MKYESKISDLNKFLKDNLVGCDSLIDYVLLNPKFALWSGCSHKDRHHYGVGGLQYHTWEVVRICNVNSHIVNMVSPTGTKDVDTTVLLLAALFHDVGKMWDYVPYLPELVANRELTLKEVQSRISHDSPVHWTSADHKRTIHHISRSGIEWTKAVAKTRCCESIEEKVLHCILSHHGMREWGSPVAPKSREAWLLFLCDGISARANDADSFDMKGQVKNV